MSNFNKNNEAIVFDVKANDTLLLSFGGIKQGLGMPAFEFYNLLKDFKCDKIFIRDFQQAWYQKGITNDINSILELKENIELYINKNKYKKVCFIGNSMGGYAAILFGFLLNIENIIAFSPQTFIDRKRRFFYRDKRWEDKINKIYSYSNRIKTHENLKGVLKENNSFIGKIDIYYSLDDRLDKIHSERLRNNDFVELHPFSKGGHNLVKELNKEGKLLDILSIVL